MNDSNKLTIFEDNTIQNALNKLEKCKEKLLICKCGSATEKISF